MSQPNLATRRFRHPSTLWIVLLLVIGGPLNPAAWWLNAPDPEKNVFLADVVVFSLIPCTVMVLTAAWILQRYRHFNLGIVLVSVSVGFAVAVFTAPLVLAISMWLTGSHGGIVWVPVNFLLVTAIGWVSVAIPYIAVTKGVPCALVVLALCVIFTTPDVEAAETTA